MLVVVAATAPACSSRGSTSAPKAIVLAVDAAHPGRVLPDDYLGLSFEASVLDSPLLDPAHSNLPALLRDLGVGRVRFGGNSLDRVTAWAPDPARPLPSWAHARVTPEDLRRLGALAGATGWQVDLGLTLGHFDAGAAAAEATAAHQLIGPGLGTIAIGNEPDLFPSDRTLEPAGYTYAAYRSQVDRDRAAIAGAVPGTAFAGPDTAAPDWLAAFGRDERHGLAFLTQHFYPLTRCGGSHPTIAELTSSATLRRGQQAAGVAASIARREGLALRLDETNSASCGGQDGVSNTLASALWMVDYLLIAAQEGVDGVNVHGGLAACRGYTPLCLPGARGPVGGSAPGIDPVADLSLGAGRTDGGHLSAQPDFYGLLLVGQLEGARWLPIRADRPGGPANLEHFGFRMPDGSIRIVIDNPDPRAGATFEVRLPHPAGHATVRRLTGPSLAATSQVEFGGSQVTAAGTWQPGAGERLPTTGAGVRVDVGPASAALVSLSS